MSKSSSAMCDYYLPGKPLNDEEITRLLESSRNSGIISMKEAHQIIRKNYNADCYTKDAFATLIQLVNFIETSNSEGAGMRWLTHYETFLEIKLSNPSAIKLCHNHTFNKFKSSAVSILMIA